MSKIFKSKEGVTILEGLVAMGVLAMVAVGVLGVVLSISRKSNQPDIREEMAYAVEQAYHDLQLYTSTDPNSPLPAGSGIPCMCSADPCHEGDPDAMHPLAVTSEERPIDCRLPSLCDGAKSSFSYRVMSSDNFPNPSQLQQFPAGGATPSLENWSQIRNLSVNFSITCNGYKL